jgi:hypothetical protein
METHEWSRFACAHEAYGAEGFWRRLSPDQQDTDLLRRQAFRDAYPHVCVAANTRNIASLTCLLANQERSERPMARHVEQASPF